MTAASASTPALERRRERRVEVQLPIVVRGKDSSGSPFEEHTASRNICRGGAAFPTRYPLDPGVQLELHIRVSSSGGVDTTEFATQGRVTHILPGSGSHEKIVGVEFTGPRFHRMFVSEST